MFYLAKPMIGGWVSYTVNLAKSFIEMGYEVEVFKVSKRLETSRRVFEQGILYQNIPIYIAAQMQTSKECLNIVTAMDRSIEQDDMSYVLSFAGAIVLHDPTEHTEVLTSEIRRCNKTIIVPRENQVDFIRKTIGKEAVFIPHPYIRRKFNIPHKTRNAVSIARLDFDKKEEIIVEANTLIKQHDKRVLLYGNQNTRFTATKLFPLDKNWRRYYMGSFKRTPFASVKIASNYHYSIDMTYIKNDGGGTQYTFLESWDAGCILVVSTRWILPGGQMKPGVNCIAVETAAELASVIIKDPSEFGSIAKAGERELEKHSPSKIVKLYESI